MFNKKSSLFIGIITLLALTYLIIYNSEIISYRSIQLLLGIVIADLMLSIINSFKERKEKLGLLLLLVNIVIFSATVLNSHVSVEGLISFIALLIVISLPIVMIIVFAIRNENNNKLY